MRARIGRSLCALALSLPASVHADDIHERQLDQQVQELRRQVDAQARRIDQLEGLMRSSGPVAPTWAQKAPAAGEAPPWLVAANWEHLRPGMSEDEVTAILGEASSERAGDSGAKTLLYAVELQEGVFLAGRVELQGGKVTTIQKPALR